MRPYPGEMRDGIRFRRSKYSDATALDSSTAAKGLVRGDAGLNDRMSALIAKVGISVDKDTCLNALAQVADLPSEKLPELIGKLLHHPDPDVRGRALAALEGYDDPAVVPPAAQALSDADPDVRLQAVEVLNGVNAPEVASALSKALDDTDLNVRQLALQAGLEQPPAARAELLQKSAASTAPDLASAALNLMDASPSKSNIPFFIRALNHPDTDVRDLARDTLALTFHEVFDSSAQAHGWWVANQRRYSQDLVEEQLIPEPTPPTKP